MRLSVLYSSDGRILAVMRSAVSGTRGVSGTPLPELAVEPAEGERLAFVDVHDAWEGRPLAEIHEALIVVDGAGGRAVQLRETAG